MESLTLLSIVAKLLAAVWGSAILPVVGGNEITLLFAGDAMQHQGQLDAARRADGIYDYTDCFAAVKDYISAADYAVVNFETTMAGGKYTGYPCFNSPDSYASALSDAGFDLFLTANNHTLDRLDRGMQRTIAVLDSLGISHIGTWSNAAQRHDKLPFVRDIKGYRIAFLNYTYGTNGFTLKGDGVVDYIDRKVIAADVKAARDAGAELIVAAVHWGVEYKLLPHPTQTSLADYLHSLGVEMVIGGHPHVIQPMKLSEADSTGARRLTIYSLGNFISNMRTTDTRGGAVAEVHIGRDESGHAVVRSADYTLVFTVPPTASHSNYRLMAIDDEAIPSLWRGVANAFAASARRIFAAHNLNVEEKNAQKIVNNYK